MDKHFLYRALQLIPNGYKKKGVLIVLLLTVGSLLDLFSLASFFPLIILIIKPEHLTSNYYLAKIYSLSALNNPMHFGVALTIAIILFVLIKTQINIWITYRKALFGYSVANVLALRALTQFLNSSYLKFTNADYTLELNRITNLPLIFTNNLLIPFGTILSEGLITTILFSVIAVYDTRLFLFLCILIIPVLLLYKTKKKRIKQTSEQIKTMYPLMLKYTLQGIEGLAEIKMYQKEFFFKNRVHETFQKLGRVFSVDHTRHTSVSKTTELIASLYIGLLIIYVLLHYDSKEDAILLLSLYAAVSFRTIPSINRIFSGFMQIKAYEYVVQELTHPAPTYEVAVAGDREPLTFHEKIELRNISFGYPNQELIFNNLSLTLQKGEKIILSGKSGSGKTSLLLLLMRLLKEQTGDVLVDGKKVDDNRTAAYRKLMGYVPQTPYILDASIVENIAFGMPVEAIDRQKVTELIRGLDLHKWVESLPHKQSTIIGEKGAKISGGQRQRIAIARALYHEAEILVLDEITNQLDRQSEEEVLKVLQTLAAQSKTIVLVTHRQELWPLFDHVYELRNGVTNEVLTNIIQTNE